jgi:hypothetical protein
MGQSFDMRRRVEGWRAAERREQVVRAHEGPMPVDAALNAAFEMSDLFPGVATTDVIRAREIADVRAAWRKLRTRLACLPVDPTNR